MWICSICFIKFLFRKETPSLCFFSILTLYSLLTIYLHSDTVLLVIRGVCGDSHTKQFSDTGCCLPHKCRLPFSHYFHVARKILPFLIEKTCLKKKKTSLNLCLSEKPAYFISIFEGFFSDYRILS